MWAPNGTSPDIIARMSRELAKALAQPGVRSRYGDLGAEPIAMKAAEFRNLLVNEGKLLSTLIREQKIIVD